VEVVSSLSQGRTAAAQCGLFTHKSVPVIFEPPCILFIIIIGGILVLFIYITRLASKEIFSPSNKILLHQEVRRAKDLPAPRYILVLVTSYLTRS